MKRIFTLLFLFLPFFMLKSQILSLDNGILFSNTKYDSKDVCNDNNHAIFLSFDYFKMKKHFYLTTQVGYFSTGYNAYKHFFLVDRHESQKFKSRDMHFSLTFRGKIPVYNNLFVYAGLGPKLDFSFDNKKKIENHTFPNLNTFKNMFGGKFDFGIYTDIQKKYRVGINTAYLTNFNNGKINTNRFVCGLSVGYIFGQSTN